jgi:hypothetical protein
MPAEISRGYPSIVLSAFTVGIWTWACGLLPRRSALVLGAELILRVGVRSVGGAAEAKPAAIVAFSGGGQLRNLNVRLLRIRVVRADWHGGSLALQTANSRLKEPVPRQR